MPKHRSYFFKYMTMFFLGASAVMLATQALDINTSLTNAYQYIQHIVLTTDGTALTTTNIELDGSNGNAYFSGNVGIGTNTPAYGLHVVNKDSMFDAGDTSFINGDVGIGYDVSNSSSGGDLYVLNNVGIGTSTPAQKLEVSGNIKLSTQGLIGYLSNQIFMQTGGNVGIGTSTPSAKLYVMGNSFLNGTLGVYDGIEIGRTGGPISLVNFLAAGSLQTSGHYGQLYLSPDGNVGIGTTNPGTKLDVAGTGKFSDIQVTNGIFKMTEPTTGLYNLSDSCTTGVRLYLADEYLGPTQGGAVATKDIIYMITSYGGTSAQFSVSYVNGAGAGIAYIGFLNGFQNINTIYLPKGYALSFSCMITGSDFSYLKISSN